MTVQNLAVLEILLTDAGWPTQNCKLGNNINLELRVIPTEKNTPEAFPIDNTDIENPEEVRFMVTSSSSHIKSIKSTCKFPPNSGDAAKFTFTANQLGECTVSIVVLRAEVIKHVEEYKFNVSE